MSYRDMQRLLLAEHSVTAPANTIRRWLGTLRAAVEQAPKFLSISAARGEAEVVLSGHAETIVGRAFGDGTR